MTPSWDLLLTVFFIIGIAYGMMLQREKSVVTLISAYVALVLTQLLSGPVGQFFTGERAIASFFISQDVSPFAIQAVLFVVLLVLVSTKSGLAGDGGSGGLLSPLEVFSYSFLSTALIASTLLSYMPEATRATIVGQSSMASFLMQYQTYWLLLPVVAILFFGWNRNPILPR